MAVTGADIGDIFGGDGGGADSGFGVDDTGLDTGHFADIDWDHASYDADNDAYSSNEYYDDDNAINNGVDSGSTNELGYNGTGMSQSMPQPFDPSTGLTNAQNLAMTNASMNWAPLQAAASMNPTM